MLSCVSMILRPAAAIAAFAVLSGVVLTARPAAASFGDVTVVNHSDKCAHVTMWNGTRIIPGPADVKSGARADWKTFGIERIRINVEMQIACGSKTVQQLAESGYEDHYDRRAMTATISGGKAGSYKMMLDY
jgi:hypothetical protein